jgi:hypothetical protein
MHDAIVAELMDREEHIVGNSEDDDGDFGYDEDSVGEDHGPENPNAAVNYGEYDREGDMAKDDLRTMNSAAKELYSILDADENLPEWVQKKITLAVDYLDTARDYMKANKYEEGVAEGGNTNNPVDDMVEDYLDWLDAGHMLTKRREEEKAQIMSDLKSGYLHPDDIDYAMSSGRGVAEAAGDKSMSRAAKGYEKYGKKGMMALAKAGRDGASEKKLDVIRDEHDRYDEGVAGPKKCWPGHRKTGTQPGTGKNAGKRVNDCEKIESYNKTGEGMSNLTEGEIQQASAIVTAKTMVDRVSRWIEELSGMENDTLLQLGDSIRDEMGQEQAKQFISSVAPAIQQALELLKSTREALSTSVRALTGEEQPMDMLGAEPGADIEAPADPDMMNPDDMGMDDEGAPDDEFSASDAGAGGLETAGREQRESIDRGNSLLRVLAG